MKCLLYNNLSNLTTRTVIGNFMNSLVLTGVLSAEELATVTAECGPLFEEGFIQAGILSKNGPEGVRSSKVKTIDIGIPNTVQIGFDLLYRTCGDYKFECYNYPVIQLLKYPAGGYYDWHTDYYRHVTEGMVRGMSLSINLNDNYTGGGLEVKDGHDYINMPNQVGGFAVFSSLHWHRALAVAEGERRVIVMWFPCKEPTMRQISATLKEGTSTPPSGFTLIDA